MIGDAVRLQQVLINLLGNAIKFTEAGRVTLRVEPAGGEAWRHDGQTRLRFAVVDTGIGIAADKRQVIFDAFRQADGSTTRKFGGTGLGLSISASLARLMGGQLEVESRQGEGSTFHFEASFAVAPVVAEAGPARVSEVREAPAGLTVLVAEDNLVNQKVIQLLLERLGHRVVIVDDGRAACERSAALDIDLVLMDVQMPVMDGLEATRAIRTREESNGERRLPIVALTARAMREDARACKQAGMDGFVTKPVERIQLVAAMTAALAPHPCEV